MKRMVEVDEMKEIGKALNISLNFFPLIPGLMPATGSSRRNNFGVNMSTLAELN